MTVAVLVSYLLVYPPLTFAAPDSCLPERGQHYLEWTQEYFDLADFVFIGSVVSAKISQIPPSNSVGNEGNSEHSGYTSMSEVLDIVEEAGSRTTTKRKLQLAEIKISQIWKGPSTPNTTVAADLFLDDTGFRTTLVVGDSYLVFAFGDEQKPDYVLPTGCALPLSDDESAAMIRVLDALTK